MRSSIHLEKLPPAPCVSWMQIRTRGTFATRGQPPRERREEAIPDVLTIEDLGRYLKIGRNGAYNLIHAEQIHYVRIGKQIRIPKKAVEAFLLGRPCE